MNGKVLADLLNHSLIFHSIIRYEYKPFGKGIVNFASNY